MCAGKLQAIFCGFDKGERGQIPGHKASGRALYGRRAFVHCQLPLEWHAPIASVAALTAQPLAALPPYGCGVPLAGSERLAGCRFGGTPADRTRHCRGAACRSRRGAADWCRLALNGENQRFVIARARCARGNLGKAVTFLPEVPNYPAGYCEIPTSLRSSE